MRLTVTAPKNFDSNELNIKYCPVSALPKTVFIDIKNKENTIETIELPTSEVTQQGIITSHKITGVSFPMIMRTLDNLGINYKSVVYNDKVNGFNII